MGKVSCVVLGLVLVCSLVVVGCQAQEHDHHGHDHHGHDHHGHDHHDHRHFYHKETYNEENEIEHHDHQHHHDHEHEHHHEHQHEHHHEHEHEHEHDNDSGNDSGVWLKALGSTFLISAAPALLLLYIPVDLESDTTQSLLKVLLAFASGGLLGDAFLHLIPHASESGHDHHHHGDHHHHHHHDHGHDHGHGHGHEGHDHTGDLINGLWILAGLFAFLLIEKIMRNIKGDAGHSHSHSHSHSKPSGESKKPAKKTDKKKAGDGNTNEHTGEIAISGFLNLAADAAHNFTDGLAIGASYATSPNIAFITVLLILLHEIPHEIGDFAILIKSGCSKKKAIMLQLVTAVGALLGTGLGLLSSELDGVTPYVLLFTAGGFIYIATVTVIPELLQASSLKQSLAEMVALVFGVAIMVVIVFIE